MDPPPSCQQDCNRKYLNAFISLLFGSSCFAFDFGIIVRNKHLWFHINFLCIWYYHYKQSLGTLSRLKSLYVQNCKYESVCCLTNGRKALTSIGQNIGINLQYFINQKVEFLPKISSKSPSIAFSTTSSTRWWVTWRPTSSTASPTAATATSNSSQKLTSKTLLIFFRD